MNTDISLNFGHILYQQGVISSASATNVLMCDLPAFHAGGMVDVRVSLNAQQFSTTSVRFW